MLYFAASIVTSVDNEKRAADLADLEDKVRAESERIYVDRDEQLAALEDRLSRRRDYFTKGKERNFDEDDEFWARGLSAWAEEQGLPPLDEARKLVGGMFTDVAQKITTEDSKKIRELVRSSAIRDDRQLSNRELDQVANAAAQINEALAPLHKEADKATGSKKGAVTKHMNKIRDALLAGEERRGRRRRDGQGRREEEPRQGARARQRAPARAARDPRRRRAGGGHPRARRRPLPPGRGPHGQGRLGRAHPVVAQGPRDVPRHRVAPRGRPRGVRRRGQPARADVAALPRPRAEDDRQRRDALPRAEGPLRLGLRVRRLLQGRHGRGGDPRAPARPRPPGRGEVPARDHSHVQGPEAEPRDQAPQGRQRVHHLGEPSRVDGPRGDPGHPAGASPDGSARRRPLRHERPERPLPARDQPEQPPQAAARPRRARDHRQQREADAAGGRRRPVRQRAPRSRGDGPGQPGAEVALRHAQGQAGPLPPEPARQARRLLGPVRDRLGPDAQAAPVRPAEAHGARALQAVHHEPARRAEVRPEHQGGEEVRRLDGTRGLGRPRGGHRRAPGSPEPRADAAPPRDPGVRARPRRGQGDPDPSARLSRVQRGLRRRPDGRPPAALRGGAGGGADPHALREQRALAGARQAAGDAVAGHDPGRLLPDVLRDRPRHDHGGGAGSAAEAFRRGGRHLPRPRGEAGRAAGSDRVPPRRRGHPHDPGPRDLQRGGHALRSRTPWATGSRGRPTSSTARSARRR